MRFATEFFASQLKVISTLLLTTSMCLLTGCSLQSIPAPTQILDTGSVMGTVRGGQQPVSGAHIYIMQAGIGGYGLAAANIGAKAIAAGRGGGTDSNGVYFVSDANGAFNISNGYTCTASRQVYLVALGGNPGLGSGKSNPALALAATLGACPSLNTFQYAIPSLQINELTTVATVYSLAGFMSSPTQVSTGTSSNAVTGLGNAFLNSTQLVSVATGNVLQSTPNGKGVVSAAKVRTLANILAPCINSDGTGGACQMLFSAATVGTGVPADTVSALLNIAHNPGANVQTLFSLASSNAPFQPALANAPADLTLSVAFSSGGSSPGIPAVDSKGSVWLPNTDASSITILDSLGNQSAMLSPLGGVFGSDVVYITPPVVAIDSSGFGWVNSTSSGIVEAYSPTDGAGVADGGGMQHADATASIALDANGNVFVTDPTAQLVAVFDNDGNPLSGTTGFATGSAWSSIALDNTGRFFVADPAASLVSGFNLSGAAATFTSGNTATFTGGGLTQPSGLAFDNANNLWVANGNNSLSKFQGTSGTTLGASAFTGGGLNFDTTHQSLVSIAVDGGGTPWVANYAGSSISHFSAAGVALSPGGSGYATAGCTPRGLAIDPSGDVWVTCQSANQPLVEFIGAAVPLRTPLTPDLAGSKP